MSLGGRNLPDIDDDNTHHNAYSPVSPTACKVSQINTLTSDNQHEDIILIEKIADGDQLAFANLVKKYSGRLYTTAYRILSDSHEAEDILQQVFTIVWQKPRLGNLKAMVSPHGLKE